MTEIGMWTKEYADEIKGFGSPGKPNFARNTPSSAARLKTSLAANPD